MISNGWIDRTDEDFVAMAAHELRGPATVMAGAADTMLRLIDPASIEPDVRELLSMIARNGRHMRKLTIDLLSSAYLERGALPLAIDRLPILPIIGWAVEAATPVDGPDVRIECDPHIIADFDPDRLEQIVTNLVSNAMAHGSPPFVVTVRSTTRGVTVAVRDFGSGVPAADVDRLFDRFTPLAARTITSSGLGLSISRGLARAMGGDLTYRRVSPGSLFVVDLPSA